MTNATIEAPTTVKPVLKQKPKPPQGVDIRDPKILDLFKKNGIPVALNIWKERDKSDLVAGTVEPMQLSLNDQRTKLDIDTGTADIRLFFDKKHRQVVIVATEKARKITREYSLNESIYGKTSSKKAEEYLRERAENGRGFPLAFPRDAEVRYEVEEFTNFEYTPQSTNRYLPAHGSVNVKVTAHVKASKTAFLAGYDEDYMFISCLPKIVTSVERAHEVLRPRGVPAGTTRVGEFFFVEVTNENLINDLDEKYISNDWAWEAQAIDLGTSDNHVVTMTVTHLGRTYAAGLVFDTNRRHSNLWLDGWYEVFVNTELEPPDGIDGNWD